MANFRYSGFKSSGDSVTGTLEAASEREAFERLGVDGILPSALEALGPAAEDDAQSGVPADARRAPKGRVPYAARVLFVRELATFLAADVPLLDALGVLRRQESNPAFQSILDEVHGRVAGGESFSKTLLHYPKIFPPLLTSMVKVGETGGTLAPVLDQMAAWMEHDEEVRNEIRGAMTYPLMILSLAILTVFILVSFALPRITGVFLGFNATLPLPTRILMGAANFMAAWWKWIIVLGVAAFFALRWALHTPTGRAAYDRVSMSLPVLGSLVRKAAITRFARAGASLLNTGVPLLDALKIIRDLLPNVLIRASVDETIGRVTRGHSLARALGDTPWFPPAATHLLAVGERTGRLGEMMDRVAHTFEKSMRAQIKVMLNLLAPLMIIALACLVGLIAISILLPIFQMTKLMR
jgi:type II secretory pathway component PulF